MKIRIDTDAQTVETVEDDGTVLVTAFDNAGAIGSTIKLLTQLVALVRF